MHTVRYLEPSQLRIWREPGSVHARVEVVDEFCVLQARFKRLFPISAQDDYLSIQDGDNKEVGILRSLRSLPVEARAIVDSDLDRRYYTPKVRRINRLVKDSGMFRFDVETDRGTASYYVRNWRDSAHEVAPGRWHIMSVDGQRFEIENLERLDRKSQNLLYQELF